jgi:parallel beta-helix repeat protein
MVRRLAGAAILVAAMSMLGACGGPPSTVNMTPGGTKDFKTLQQAVDGVKDGGQVNLAAGTYRLDKPLIVARSIRIIGAGKDSTEVLNAPGEAVVRFQSDGKVTVENIAFTYSGTSAADVVTVDKGSLDVNRCVFSGGVKQQKQGGSGLIVASGASATVRECEATKNDTAGLSLTGQSQVTVTSSDFSNNDGAGIACSSATSSGSAGSVTYATPTTVFVVDSSPTAASGSVLTQNTCSQNGTSGIVVTDGAPTVQQNECKDNTKNGIEVGLTAAPVLEKNTCSSNGTAGISYSGSAKGTANQNICIGNKKEGVLVSNESQPILESNLCTQSTAGVLYTGKSGGSATKNRCSQNKIDGIQVKDSASPSLLRNTCRGNKTAGISYWGNSHGRASQNQCNENGFGIACVNHAKPSLIGNVKRAGFDGGYRFPVNAVCFNSVSA